MLTQQHSNDVISNEGFVCIEISQDIRDINTFKSLVENSFQDFFILMFLVVLGIVAFFTK